MNPARAVVLLSGGLDSATTLAVARARRFDCTCLTIDYDQRHRHELRAAAAVAAALGAADHRVMRLDLRAIGGSALTDDIPVPKGRTPNEMDCGVPVTYVPARNLVFLSLSVALAEVIGADAVFIGVNAVDYSGYPDCREAFIRAFESAANLATKAGTQDARRLIIHAPLIDLTKAQIIRAGAELGVDFALTHSCYDPTPEGHACAGCDACLIRRRGFTEAGLPDPTPYALEPHP